MFVFVLSPGRYARYRTTGGGQWDTKHYDGDQETFIDSDDRVWRRTALTRNTYQDTRFADACRELDAIEAQEPS